MNNWRQNLEWRMEAALARRIRERRLELDISLKDLSEKTGLPANEVSDQEDLLLPVLAIRLLILCEGLKLDPMDLLREVSAEAAGPFHDS